MVPMLDSYTLFGWFEDSIPMYVVYSHWER